MSSTVFPSRARRTRRRSPQTFGRSLARGQRVVAARGDAGTRGAGLLAAEGRPAREAVQRVRVVGHEQHGLPVQVADGAHPRLDAQIAIKGWPSRVQV